MQIDFPELTSLKEYPLHPKGEDHYKCNPHDNNAETDWRCYRCVSVELLRLKDFGDEWCDWTIDGDQHKVVKLSYLVARSIYYGVLTKGK